MNFQMKTLRADCHLPADINATTSVVVDVHSLHKSGTMFLYNFFERLAKERNFKLLSENHSPPDDYSLVHDFTPTNSLICRAPVRTFHIDKTQLESSTTQQKRIFHLRDPRDILVSEYYSFGWIHPTDETPLSDRRNEIQQMSVDEYVVTQSEVCTWPVDEKYAPLEDYEFDLENELVVKYEQMVTSFSKWCQLITTFMELKHPTWLTAKLAWKYRNEFKTSGETLTHKRRITPGDHQRKLTAKSIDVLNQRFEKVLKRFGYLN